MWSNNKIMDFINAVHLRRELWDVEESSFRNRVAKKDGWQAVGEEFGISGVEASKKFKNLRTYAQNERKKQKSGSGASKKKPWFAFEAIQFVLARDIPNAGVDSENRTTGCANDLVDNERETGGMEQESLSDFEEKESPENSRPASRAVSRKRSKSTTPFDEETVNAAKTVLADACKRRNQRTTCSAFGELVAQKLADYDPRTRSQVEMKVMQVLHEADMQMYDTPTTSFSQCNVTVTSGEYSGGDVDKLEQPQATEEMTAIRDILAEAFQVVDEE